MAKRKAADEPLVLLGGLEKIRLPTREGSSGKVGNTTVASIGLLITKLDETQTDPECVPVILDALIIILNKVVDKDMLDKVPASIGKEAATSFLTAFIGACGLSNTTACITAIGPIVQLRDSPISAILHCMTLLPATELALDQAKRRLNIRFWSDPESSGNERLEKGFDITIKMLHEAHSRDDEMREEMAAKYVRLERELKVIQKTQLVSALCLYVFFVCVHVL